MEVGLRGALTKQVNDNETADLLGSGLLGVFATPALVAFVENTCWKSIDEFLEEGQTTVGTNITLDHLKANLPGDEITCFSEIVEIDGKKIVFEFEVKNIDKLIAKGSHTRFIVDSEKFMEKLS